MNKIKENAQAKADELRRRMEDALYEIREIVKEKTDQLKSDRNELNR